MRVASSRAHRHWPVQAPRELADTFLEQGQVAVMEGVVTGHSERLQSRPMTAVHVPSERLQLADAVGQRVDGELDRPQRRTTVSVLGVARPVSADLQRCVSSEP